MFNNRYYSELITIRSFDERFEYLKLNEQVGYDKFSHDRAIHEAFYRSAEWKECRRNTIIRDNCMDLAFEGHDIPDGLIIIIHHINPISTEDIIYKSRKLFDPENLITTIKNTHDGLHYGELNTLKYTFADRKPNDTKLW